MDDKQRKKLDDLIFRAAYECRRAKENEWRASFLRYINRWPVSFSWPRNVQK